jgi:pimeloyl-ACP methyl ester carboxylesterase
MRLFRRFFRKLLSNSKFFAGLAEAVLIFDLKQVRLYLRDQVIRYEARQRVLNSLCVDTRVLIGHSLGSVVAYEALCMSPKHQVHTFITLGSPLGIKNLIFEQLEPAPRGGIGQWPPGLKQWFNIADSGDIVALVKDLASRFGDGVSDRRVYNGSQAHDAARYLSSKEAGDAVASGL